MALVLHKIQSSMLGKASGSDQNSRVAKAEHARKQTLDRPLGPR